MKVKLLAQFIILLLCLVVSCEWFVYYVVQLQCDWPTINSTLSVQHNNEKALRTMVFADTHLLGSRRGHWFDKLRREWQMYRAFQTALTLHRPDVVFLLGDITDEGDYCSDDEFRYYVKRFDSLFVTPFDVKIFVVAGNHDMGFHYRITPYLNKRFISGFNASAVQFVTLRGNHFVLINSMALEGDGCFLCKSAELQLAQIEKKLNCLKSEGNCQRDNLTYSRPILMQVRIRDLRGTCQFR
uniref:Calcineurin-like phosphoesterase domain-containing protein n=1 Tax=Photinus pyralis TaxID=7054 RepID=A0A1Y1KE96_PHOPY